LRTVARKIECRVDAASAKIRKHLESASDSLDVFQTARKHQAHRPANSLRCRQRLPALEFLVREARIQERKYVIARRPRIAVHRHHAARNSPL
jgi:hypothetical protein